MKYFIMFLVVSYFASWIMIIASQSINQGFIVPDFYFIINQLFINWRFYKAIYKYKERVEQADASDS